MVAKHAGYNIVEINASDDRSTEKFKTALENATSMHSVIDSQHRPNCLIFDEIDGAPATSIDFLIKFITGMHVTKTKKGKAKKAFVLKRPIICICNDVYVPALRSLRKIAFVVNFPHTSSTRLAERLLEICKYENIKVDIRVLLALAEKTNNDIRSCLSVLQFFKSHNKSSITLADVHAANVGQKDMQRSLFATWQEILQLQKPKRMNEIVQNAQLNGSNMSALSLRMKSVIHAVNCYGDHDKLMQGVFENYPKMYAKDSSMNSTLMAVEWFCFNDLLNSKIMSIQNYSLSTYLQFGFVMWNYVFASYARPNIVYPNTQYEVSY